MNWQWLFRVIKWTVPVFIAFVLFKKFYGSPNVSLHELSNAIQTLNWYWLIFLLSFSFFNWAIETRKWQYLICKIEIQSFKIAFKSVMSGVAVSQLLPYRTGEYLGRLAYVDDEHKLQAGFLSIIGSFSQLLMTLVFGIVSFIILKPIAIPFDFLLSAIVLIITCIVIIYIIPKLSIVKRSKLYQALKHALNVLSYKDIIRLLGFSMLRYSLFLIPYALLALHFDLISDNFILSSLLSIACIYLLQTISPNFILTDVAIRISVPALVFSGSIQSLNGREYIPGLIIYLFNVLIPMCLGAIILLSLKLKKQ